MSLSNLKNSFVQKPLIKCVLIIIIFTIFFIYWLNINSKSILKLSENDSSIGKQLFFDTRLSANNTKSCANCHNPQLYFTDGYKKALGIYADIQMRNTPSLINSRDFKSLNWANPSIITFEEQMAFPLFNKVHLEMGMNENDSIAFQILNQAKYTNYIITNKNKNWNYIKKCLSLYQQTLISRNSKFDLFLKDSTRNQLSTDEKNGMQLFFSNKFKCSTCHGGKDFNTQNNQNTFGNNLLYSKKEYKNLPDKGVFLESGNFDDIGKFRIPSLRNVMKTQPYMHDGSMENMTIVMEHYNSKMFQMTNLEKKLIISFLETLTDESILKNNFFQPPK